MTPVMALAQSLDLLFVEFHVHLVPARSAHRARCPYSTPWMAGGSSLPTIWAAKLYAPTGENSANTKARGRFDSDPALCAGALLLSLAQQAQANRDKRQDNADDGLATEQAAGDDQALLLEGGVLGSLLLV